jgi:hypothetical protein
MELAERGIITVHYFVFYVLYFPTDADFQEIYFKSIMATTVNTLSKTFTASVS